MEIYEDEYWKENKLQKYWKKKKEHTKSAFENMIASTNDKPHDEE